MKPHKHVIIIAVETDRKFFTTHGLHMSNLGKEKVAYKISMVITNIFQKESVITRLCWKNGYDEIPKSVSDNQEKDVSETYVSDNSTEIPKSVSDNQEKNVSETYVSDNSTETTISIINPTAPTNQVKVPNRVSSRQKKPPQTKSDDFLWQA
jgi:hypothetical protein